MVEEDVCLYILFFYKSNKYSLLVTWICCPHTDVPKLSWEKFMTDTEMIDFRKERYLRWYSWCTCTNWMDFSKKEIRVTHVNKGCFKLTV